jgi:hypothetical protein
MERDTDKTVNLKRDVNKHVQSDLILVASDIICLTILPLLLLLLLPFPLFFSLFFFLLLPFLFPYLQKTKQ